MRSRITRNLSGVSNSLTVKPASDLLFRWWHFIFNQQHECQCDNDFTSLQKPLACGIVLQVDQTAPVRQAIFRTKRQRRAVANLDCDVCLPPDFEVEKTPGPRPLGL